MDLYLLIFAGSFLAGWLAGSHFAWHDGFKQGRLDERERIKRWLWGPL